MHKLKQLISFLAFFVAFPSFLFAADESITVTTYYPSPYGVYREMRAQRMAVGDNYVQGSSYCWDGTCTTTINADADLVVEGNVGIGTTNPVTKLDVRESGNQINIDADGTGTNYSGYPLTLNRSGSSADGTLMHGAYVDNATYYWGQTHSSFGSRGVNFSYGTGISFYADSVSTTKNSSFTPAERMRITNAGNVGIGTTNPVAQLQVHGAGGATNQIRVSNTTTGYGVDISGQTTGGLINVRNAAGTSVINIDANSSANSFFNTGGNVGIGTASPLAKLNIYGTMSTGLETGLMLTNTSGKSWLIHSGVQGTSHNYLGISDYTDDPLTSPKLVITNGGSVGIGTTSPSSFKLQIAGNVGPNTDNTYDLGSSSYRWRYIYSPNVLQTSDAREKTNIIDTPLGLDFIMHLRPVQYNWIKNDDGKLQGIIAQELEAALKEKGTEFSGLHYDQKTDTYSLAYTEFIAPLIKAVQEQQGEIEVLKAKIAGLEARFAK
ncbi:MAG: tail fiber domain-containing protein [Candidatus Omnitrophica bacterium]|nr:tail fiber domain-containing protein [Candidatus Omnitrophota bacterium]